MKARRAVVAAVVLLLCAPTWLVALQRFRGGMCDHDENPEAPNPNEETEYYFARLVYGGNRGRGGYGRRGRGSWATDTPAAERYFLQGVRRLTNIHARSREEYIRTLDDKLFDYPWIYAVEVGSWYLDEEEAARMREYLLRGGFLMCDDFHGGYEWMAFLDSMQRVFPDRPIVELDPGDPVFHTLYSVDQRMQVPGIQYVRSGSVSERVDGSPPHWRGIYDDKGRLMVVINFNMDLGDAWEWADCAEYPEPFTALAYRFGINYIIYSMTH
jgi:hypothetical protein